MTASFLDSFLLCAFLIATGLAVGSFAATAIERALAGERFVFGRSRCNSCSATLKARDLVPVLSWLTMRGRCRFCDIRIGWYYPGVELAFALVPLWAFSVVPAAALVPSVAFGWLLLALAIFDCRALVLPDVLTLSLFATGLAFAAWSERSIPVDALLGAAGGALFLWLVAELYRRLRHREGLGMGDVKLVAGLGGWLGWQGLPSALLIAALGGLLATTAILLYRRRFSLVAPLPFGAYLAAGGWITWLYGPLDVN